jgi:hypothetical protein
VLDIVITADGTGDQEFQTFIEISCGLFVSIGGFGGKAEGGDMDGMPEKGSPDFWREMHSIPPNDFDRGHFPQNLYNASKA